MFLTFEGFAPPALFPPDDPLFTQFRIEESVDGVVPVTIEGPAALPTPPGPVVDPANPPTYNFTTQNATLEVGYYRVVFMTATPGAESASPWAQRVQPLIWTPSVQTVADLLVTRTKVGTSYARAFTDKTNPTASDVASILEQATVEVGSKIGFSQSDPDIIRSARMATSLYAAMLVELTFFPEQVRREQSPYAEYKVLYDERMETLMEDVANALIGEEADSVDAAVKGAVYSFPENTFPAEGEM